MTQILKESIFEPFTRYNRFTKVPETTSDDIGNAFHQNEDLGYMNQVVAARGE